LSKSLEQRFWEKVDKSPGHGPSGDCWLWTACKNEKGYGRFDRRFAHRVAFELTDSFIPTGLFILHSCDNPHCVNPAHLRPGTKLENKHDSIKKNRHSYGEKHGRAILTEKMVLEIRRLRAKGMSGLKIAALLGVNYRAVYRVANREFWKHVKSPKAVAS
jgi:hypothetical protein